jgi:hypothetical protein
VVARCGGRILPWQELSCARSQEKLSELWSRESTSNATVDKTYGTFRMGLAYMVVAVDVYARGWLPVRGSQECGWLRSPEQRIITAACASGQGIH